MPKRKQPTAADQHRQFVEKAREIGADTDDTEDEIMRRLVGQERPPPKRPKNPSKTKTAK